MHITHLISTSKFVKQIRSEQENILDNLANKSVNMLARIMKYTDFNLQKPTLDMFVAIDSLGNKVEYPNKYDYFADDAHQLGTTTKYPQEQYSFDLCAYEIAYSSVLFKDWIYDKNDNRIDHVTGIRININDFNSLEELTFIYKNNIFEFTDNALKQFN